LNESDLARRLLPRIWINKAGEPVTNRDVVLKVRIPVETWQKVQAAMSEIGPPVQRKLSRTESAFYRDLRQSAVFARDDQLRVYPSQTLAAHVLGFASPAQREVEGKTVNEIVGHNGIELTLNHELQGVCGWRLTETDRRNRELVPLREQDVAARDGLNVVLTIDSAVQQIVESALADGMAKHTPDSISAIVVRPRTGEILAMANLPTYDPNNPGATSPDTWRNRAISDVAEPGSTFKIVVISGALNDNIVRLTDVFDCEHGHFFFAGRTLHDHESYGNLTVENIIMKSSNIGAAKVGIKLGESRLSEYIHDYGFGARAGVPLPGEVSGIMPPQKWSKVSIAQIPMGQGIAVTRLQMIMAMCAIANHGVLMRPMLVDRLEDRDHNVLARYVPERVRQVIGEPAANLMVEALKTVVSPEGTAPKAALEHYTVAGKTGTAQKVERGVYVAKYFSSFIGFFPADKPEICISVMMDDPKQGYYGGQTAAPIFKQIAERAANYLNIPPEDATGSPETEALIPPLDNQAGKTVAVRSP
jgi:cell division protein FtsI/penicillin-binding protein 2